MKKQARKDLVAICRALPNLKFDVRINAVNSKEYKNDAQILKEISKQVSSVFIPKVETAAQLERFSENFPATLINPIFETVAGINNIAEILTSPVRNKIDYAFFGNYDFHLDAQIFPVQEQNTAHYWQIVQPMIAAVEKHGLRFGNSPYAHLDDMATLSHIHHQLNLFCKRSYAVMCLHRSQTSFFVQPGAEFPQDLVSTPSSGFVAAFIKNKLKGRSFALLPQNKIITPHEYLLSKLFHG